MPSYIVTDNRTGRKLKLTGDRPPTDTELEGIFNSYQPQQSQQPSNQFGTGPQSAPGTYGQRVLRNIGGAAEHAAELAGNLPGSVARMVPEAITGVAMLGGATIIPEPFKPESVREFQRGAGAAIASPVETAQSIGQYYGQRYGTPEAAGRSLIEDPARTMLDVGGAFAAGGQLLRGAGALSKVGAFGRAGEALTAAGGEIAAAPITVPTSAAVAAARPVVGATQRLANIGRAAEIGLAESERFKIPTTLGEDLNSPFLQRTETLLERVPVVGTSAFRKQQAAAAQEAATNFLNKYIIDPTAADAGVANRAYSDKLYQSVRDLVSEVPVQEITPTNTANAARSLLDRYPDIFKKFQDTQTENLINNIVSGTEGRMATTSPLQLGTKTYIPKTNTFDELWTLRKGLGEKVGRARAALKRGEVDRTEFSQLNKLFGAVSDDIDTWTAQIGRGDIRNKFKAANDSYKQYVVKHDVVQRAYDDALGLTNAGETFSPKKFSTALKKIAYKNKAQFTTAEVNEMTGLANIMQKVKRAGQFMENPPTGNRWGPLAVGMGGYAVGGAQGLATGTFVVGMARFLTTTNMGKRIVQAAAKLNPSAQAMDRLLNKVASIYERNGNSFPTDKGPPPPPTTPAGRPTQTIPLTWVSPEIERELMAGRMSLRGPQGERELYKSLLKNIESDSNKALDREFAEYAREQQRQERLKRGGQ